MELELPEPDSSELALRGSKLSREAKPWKPAALHCCEYLLRVFDCREGMNLGGRVAGKVTPGRGARICEVLILF